MPVIVIGAFCFQRRAQPLYAQVRARVGLLGARLAGNVAGIATIKSFATEEHEAARVRRDSADYVAANRKAIAVSSAFIPVIRMAILVGFCATFLLGGWMTLDGTLNIGAYSVLVYLTQRLLWPLTVWRRRWTCTSARWRRRAGSSTCIETPIAIRDRAHARSVAAVKGALEFRNVTSPTAATSPCCGT